MPFVQDTATWRANPDWGLQLGYGLDAALGRVGGVRVNASALSHAELDELGEGAPALLARDNAALRDRMPAIQVLGGCCGTDHRTSPRSSPPGTRPEALRIASASTRPASRAAAGASSPAIARASFGFEQQAHTRERVGQSRSTELTGRIDRAEVVM